MMVAERGERGRGRESGEGGEVAGGCGWSVQENFWHWRPLKEMLM